MGKLVVLTFAEGDLDKRGFSVTLQLGEEAKPATLQEMGSLPPNPELVESYTSWKVTYYGFIGVKVRKLEAKVAQTTNFSIGDVNAQAKNLSLNFNHWLKSQQFSHIREELIAHLKQDDEVQLIIQTSNIQLRQLPWHLWDILERYPKAEISVSAPKFKQVTSAKLVNNQVNILAILGDSEGINVEEDRRLLNSIPGVKIEFLVNPNREIVTNKLWEQSWEILFFAGHSCTEGETGIIYINKTESLTIPDLKYALKKAIEKGLQLAIFNSCDGLGLAQDLADLNLPQMIVMREPVPDKVAQEFLKYFLRSFSGGQSFYLAVKEARQRLHGLENQFPCASWLPVICQNLAVIPLAWEHLRNYKSQDLPEKLRHNLPQPDYGLFIGREQEVNKILEKLRPYPHSQNSVITVDGIGGIGKSALALEIAHCFRRNYAQLSTEERFEAIIWTSAKRTVLRADRGIVSRRQVLQTLDDICKTITITLGIEIPIRTQPKEMVELVCRQLTKQRTLLIVDNLETVDDEAVMELLQDLLPAPTKAIVTTRHRIDVAYPVRLRGMPWEDAERLIEQESHKKEVSISNENKRKIYDRTGGVPLAIVWTIAKIGFGASVDNVLARLGSRKGDIARFCFEETVEKIKDKDAYKVLLALALCKGNANREALGEIAGFGEDEVSRDEGLEYLQILSLVNKEGNNFSLLPLTKEYAIQELEICGEFIASAVSRLIKRQTGYYTSNIGYVGDYLVQYKKYLSEAQIKEAVNTIANQLWYDSQQNLVDPYYAQDWYYSWQTWLATLKALGGKIAITELKSWINTIVYAGYDPDPRAHFGFSMWEISGCLSVLGDLKEYESIIEIFQKFEKDLHIKEKCIEQITNSGNQEFSQILRHLLIKETNPSVKEQLQQSISKLEQL
ncbi:hypothetical protein C7B67_00100 [filamentous cyanobacterium Phorm 6]|nr:hypothetical protein C7B67_00100 [filamentous cyanobacterium Phorm 6]